MYKPKTPILQFKFLVGLYQDSSGEKKKNAWAELVRFTRNNINSLCEFFSSASDPLLKSFFETEPGYLILDLSRRITKNWTSKI